MTDLIQKLTDNRYPFGMWPEPECYGKELGEAMQAKAEEIGITNNFRKFCGTGWGGIFKATGIKFHREDTYCLRADYEEPKPGIVECKVYEHDGRFRFKDVAGTTWSLDYACGQIDFIGFKYSHGHVSASSRVYQLKDRPGITIPAFNATHLPDDIEVLTPTHVLFRSKQ